MANPYFHFKQFTVFHHLSAMKITTDACLLGAWAAQGLQKENKTFYHTLDIGTGTGLLSLMVAQKLETCLHAVEIDSAAAQQAQENFAQSPWRQRLHVIEGDINKLSFPTQYDCIISNPPFYEGELASPNAARSLAHHSQQLKLAPLFEIISRQLAADGVFYLLLPYKRKREIEHLLAQKSLHIHVMVEVQPTVAHSPFRLLLKGSKTEATEKQIESLSIRNADGQYTTEFAGLLKDYYLYL